MRVRLTVAYNGAGFRGFAVNAGIRSVAGELTDAISTVARTTVILACAGRTDKGVHARGQVVSFDLPAGIDLGRLVWSVNSMVGPEIAVRDAEVVADDFDARRSATARVYRYSILNRPTPDPFAAATSWHVPAPLELTSMTLACDPLIGDHDFSAFCRRGKSARAEAAAAALHRRVLSCRWVQPGEGLLVFEITAASFCHQMVRAIVGTLVEVGTGERRAGDISAILRSGDRRQAADLAPPHGLCLWHVDYG